MNTLFRSIFHAAFAGGLFFSVLITEVTGQESVLRSVLMENSHAFDEEGLESLTALAAERPVVLLGESTHGTSEYYSIRARISQKLIEEYGFNFVIVEGDWTSSWEVNKYVKQLPGAAGSAREALSKFNDRWPHWMWNNAEVLELVEWMRDFNDGKAEEEMAGFYGLDVYSFWDSVDEISKMTDDFDDETGRTIERALDCLLRFNRNHEHYIRNAGQTGEHCGREIRSARDAANEAGKPDGFSEYDWLYLQQNLNVLVQGDLHYRGMLDRGAASWNERVAHFKNSLSFMLDWYSGVMGADPARGIVWAHNTHIGDARATEMANQGMRNIGELSRVRYGQESVFAIGFGTYLGEVKAGTQWESPMHKMQIPEAASGSIEYKLNDPERPALWLDFSNETLAGALSGSIPHRAIGVVYQPQMDGRQNYVATVMPERYNAFIFIRETTAVNPLD